MTQIPVLEKLKTSSVEQLMSALAIIRFAEQNSVLEDFNYDDSIGCLRTELESRSTVDLVNWMFG